MKMSTRTPQPRFEILAMTIWDQELRGRSDLTIAEICKREERTLVTFDIGFADIRMYPPKDFAGLIVLRLVSQSRDPTLQAIGRLVLMFAEQNPAGQLWIVDEHSVRIRGQEGES